ncbi:MAG: WbqC family protein [Odoribacter sp.]|nr:WbqC family protein [Odoribacter sp.]
MDLKIKPYYQTFSDRFPFIPDLSILDLIFNMGPESSRFL